MGSYLEALAEHHKIIPDVCKTIWARPNKCIVGEDQHTIDCAYAWSQAWKRFDSEQGGFLKELEFRVVGLPRAAGFKNFDKIWRFNGIKQKGQALASGYYSRGA